MKYLIAILILAHGAAFADLDKDQRQGLDDTKAFLKNRGQRDAFIKGDGKAKAADDRVEALVGNGANKEEVYGISAEVMDKLTFETNGDPVKMQQVLLEATQNPEKFYDKYFDAKAKARVRNVSDKVQSPPAPAPR